MQFQKQIKIYNTKINDEKRNHSIFGGLDQLSLMAANQDTVKKEKIQYAKRLDLMNRLKNYRTNHQSVVKTIQQKNK